MSLPATRRIARFLLFVGLAAPLPAFAEEPVTPPPAEMDTVTVTGQAEDQLTGSNTLDRSTLERLPARNGSINEALGILPGVQLPELGRTSTTAGEIIPPKVSISGGKTYQNNFLIDGISNNSLLDPESDDPQSQTLVPGHPQALFLDTDLIEQINVYRYNVPACYGSFTGGVVDVKTREPGPKFWGEATYRTTRHEWTQFHIDQTIEEEFENSISQRYQPEFEKHDVGLLLNTPITSRLSLLTSYQLNYSSISVSHLLDEEVLTRRNENFFAKLAYDLDARTRLTATVQHAPYQADYLYPNALGSEFTIDGGGDQIGLGFEHATELGKLSLAGAWKSSENRRDASGDFYTWAATASKPWGTSVGTRTPGYANRTAARTTSLMASYEGNVGSLETSQEGFELKGDFEAKAFATGPLIHQVNIGFAFEQATGMMKRGEAHSAYYTPSLVPASFKCPPGLTACIDGQQFMTYWQYFAPGKVRETINLMDGYVEDLIAWDRLEMRPGVRISYDDFMENTNVSPRLAASYDLFGDDRTLLIGGLSRYYGRTLLTYKLREASVPAVNYIIPSNIKLPNNRINGIPAWPSTPTSTNRPYRYSELDSPYTNEAVIGLDQELGGGRLKLTGLRREGRDEFSQETFKDPESGLRYYQLTNRGESHHQEASLEWERSWEKHYVAVNVTWQETETNNENYGDSIELADLSDIYWYEGDYVAIDDLPRHNFNRNWTANLIYSTSIPLGITFTNVTRYRSGYEALVSLSKAEKSALGISPNIAGAYKNEDFPDALVFDWRFDWDMLRDQSFLVSLEINNVFDEKVELGDPDSSSSSNSSTYVQNYELGRQFWLGLTYKF